MRDVAWDDADDLVIVALSGGASAMFTRPAEGLTLDDKIAVNQALLKAGASIRELNIVRKHLSAVKGGRLLHHCGGARVLGLIISDVPGNDLATIGSGLTAGDWSSFGDAVAVLKRRSVWGRAPEAVRSYLERAVAGEVGAMVKIGDPILERVTNVIIGDSNLALEGAERAAAELGYHPQRWKALHGEANDAGRALAEYMCEITHERVCVIAGGEPVVTVRGAGKGGRAQQCALAMGIELSQIGRGRRIAALVAGTDGIDGPTDAAGAFASPETVADGERAGVSRRDRIDAQRLVQFFHSVGRTVRDGADRDQRERRFFRPGELLAMRLSYAVPLLDRREGQECAVLDGGTSVGQKVRVSGYVGMRCTSPGDTAAAAYATSPRTRRGQTASGTAEILKNRTIDGLRKRLVRKPRAIAQSR